MAQFTQEQNNRIIARFNELAPDARCNMCGKDSFSVIIGAVIIKIDTQYPNYFSKGNGGELVNVALICETCGTTFLVNLKVLGLDDLLK